MSRSRLLPALLLAGLWPAVADALTFVVNTTDVDLPDTNTGLAGCDANPVQAGDQCTLRAAIMQANASAGADTIVLPLNQTITLNLAGIGGAESGDLDITAPVTITGVSLGFPADFDQLPRVQASFADRLFDIAQDIEVTLRGMVLADGAPAVAAGGNGGALRITATGANVLVDRVRFTGNSATTGAAIANSGTLIVERSDFLANIAGTAAAAIQTNGSGNTTVRASSIREIRINGGDREALRVAEGGILVVENSHIDGASQLAAPPQTPTGGIRAVRPGLLVVRNTTLVDFSERGLDMTVDGNTQVRVYNSILAGSDGGDCAATVIAGPPADVVFQYNNIQSTLCGALTVGSIGVPPNFGPPETAANRYVVIRRPLFASAAIDAGAPADAPGTDPLRLCLATDVLGTSRPLDGDADGTPRCDIGAVETTTLSASTYVVNATAADLEDANPGDDVCDADLMTPGSQCTLRAAVMEANAKPGPDRIEFAPVPGPVLVGLDRAGLGGASIGDLDVTEQLAIDGAGPPAQRYLIDAEFPDRILDVNLPPGQSFVLRNLSLRDGDTTGFGGALRSTAALTEIENVSFASNEGDDGGGAVAAFGGMLVVRHSHFSSNNATERGGALLSQATITRIEDSSFTVNGSSDAFDGAAIQLEAGASALLRGVTLSGNDGGITATGIDTIDLRASTIVGNDTFGLRVIDDPAPGSTTARVRATILADNPSNNCQFIGSFFGNEMSHNLLDLPNGSCAPAGSNAIVAEPQLAPVLHRPNGRLAMVRLPLTGSPVIDAVPGDAGEALCSGTDARGGNRPIDSDGDGAAECEIGAVELSAAEAGPRQFVVNFASDFTDHAPGDGVCRDFEGSSRCTLRAAVMEANALPGADRILLPGSGTYTLSIPAGPDPDPAAHGDLDISDELRITGTLGQPAGRPTIVANHGSRHFRITSVAAPVILEGLRLTGSDLVGPGGALRIGSSAAVSLRQLVIANNTVNGPGGAIEIAGSTVLIEDSDLHGNTASGAGAGILADASFVELRRSSVRGNVGSGGGADAIRIAGNSVFLLDNSTVSGNQGHGLRVVDGSLTVRNSTIAFNSTVGLEFIRLDGRNLVIRNTALTGNGGGACSLTGIGNAGIATDSYNLTQGNGCNLQTGLSNVVEPSTVLGPLVVNASEYSAFHIPLAVSALRDAGHPDISALGCTAADQRGIARPIDGNGDGVGRCDIGAIEAATVADTMFGDGFE